MDLNARNVALSHPQRFLPLIADSIHAGEHEGIQELLLSLIQIKALRERMSDFSATMDAGEVGRAVGVLCHEFESSGGLGPANQSAWAVLRGADLVSSDDASKREKALSRIAALAWLFRAIGLKGLVLMLDEAETIDQLWNIRSRLSAYAVLGRPFRIESLWCVLGSTHKFDQTIRSDLSNATLATTDAATFLKGWEREEYQVVEPPVIGRQGARELAQAVTSLYQLAYHQVRTDTATLWERCVEDWMRNPIRNPRRLVRLLVHRLDVERDLDRAD